MLNCAHLCFTIDLEVQWLHIYFSSMAALSPNGISSPAGILLATEISIRNTMLSSTKMGEQIPILAMATNGVLLSNLRPLSIGLLISLSVHIYVCGVEWGGVGCSQAAWSNPTRHSILRTQSNQCTSPKDGTWSTTAVNWPVTCPWREIIEFGKGDVMPIRWM